MTVLERCRSRPEAVRRMWEVYSPLLLEKFGKNPPFLLDVEFSGGTYAVVMYRRSELKE